MLSFDRPLVIVGGGAVDGALLKSLADQGVAVIAADGGAMVCEAVGVVPQAIIGDMDSVDNLHIWEGRSQILRIDEQETTDFEKCLYSSSAPVTIAMGMTGGRLDHTLAALDAVVRFAQERAVIFVDEEDIAMGISGAISFAAEPGERVSVHPLQSVRFARSTGLKYMLDGLTLAPGIRTGTSNEATGQVTIEPVAGEDGVWLLILGRDRLQDMVSLGAELFSQTRAEFGR